MRESTNVLLYTTIGDLIKKYREQANLNITQLANLSGISKDVISKIELGDIKKPRLSILKALASVIDIPYQEIVEHYVEVEQKPEVLHCLLLEVIQFSDASLISKVALKFLQSPRVDTYELIEQLYTFVANITNSNVRIILYDTIIKYSRERGVQRFLAKGLLQKYLIERNDFTKLEQTYKSGSYVLHYIDFLCKEERSLLYHLLGVHAYNIEHYHESIELCKKAAAEDVGDSGIKARAINVIANAYFYLNKFDEAEMYLDIYKSFAPLPFIEENVKITSAVIMGKKGHVEVAIAQLEECLKSTSKDIILNVVNRLFELHLETNNFASIKNLLKHEVKAEELKVRTPSQFSEVALFYKLKGIYSLNVGDFDNAIDWYIKGALMYGQVSNYVKAFQCLGLITKAYLNHKKQIDLFVLNKLDTLYNKLQQQHKIGGRYSV